MPPASASPPSSSSSSSCSSSSSSSPLSFSSSSPASCSSGCLSCIGVCRVHRMKRILWQWRRFELGIAVLIALLVIAAQIRPPCLWPYLVLKRYPKLAAQDNSDVTLVTAYFNLGRMEKAGQTFSIYKYLQWAGVFEYAMNPLVVFTDSEQVENMFLETRKHLANKTRIIRVHRSQLRSFQQVEKIRALFQDPQYPKHHPNTVVAEYPCSQHAKYELVHDAIDKGYFSSTKFIAWIDIGYFRYLTRRRRKFYVVTPPGMDESKIAMTEVNRGDMSLFPSDIFRGNLVWVGGGMSVGTRPVFREFVEEYEQSTERFLSQGLSNTDQQVIYSMFTDINNVAGKVRTKIQTYTWFLDRVDSCWFYLGYLCYREVD